MFQRVRYIRSDITGEQETTTSQADILTSPSIAWNRAVRQVAQTLNTTGHFLTEDSAGRIVSKETAERYVSQRVLVQLHFEIIKKTKGSKK